MTQNNIEYQKEKTFDDFPKRKFDFYLPKENILIEFDGEQHYKFIEFFHGTVEKFKERQQADIEKNNYCIEKEIKLFRIPYWEEENISEILKQILLEKSSTTIEKFIVK